MTKIRELHKQWSNDPAYKEEYEKLSTEFELARVLIETRANAGLTQEGLADRMGTTQSVIARMESGRRLPSAGTLKRFAMATGTHLEIRFKRDLPAKVNVI